MSKPRSELLQLLGLDMRADETAIKSRYRELAKVLHPDIHGGDEVRFREVTAAYHALLDNPPPEPGGQAQDSRQGPAMHARWRASRRHTPSEFPAWFQPTPDAGQRRDYRPDLLQSRRLCSSLPSGPAIMRARAMLRRL